MTESVCEKESKREVASGQERKEMGGQNAGLGRVLDTEVNDEGSFINLRKNML